MLVCQLYLFGITLCVFWVLLYLLYVIRFLTCVIVRSFVFIALKKLSSVGRHLDLFIYSTVGWHLGCFYLFLSRTVLPGKLLGEWLVVKILPQTSSHSGLQRSRFCMGRKTLPVAKVLGVPCNQNIPGISLLPALALLTHTHLLLLWAWDSTPLLYTRENNWPF